MNRFFGFYPPAHFDAFFLTYRWPLTIAGLLLTGIIVYSKRLDQRKVERITIALQLIQILSLNAWYFISRYQWLSQSLPLYHCRVFMLGLVTCHYLNYHRGKMFFAVGGLLGALVAFLVPETDPFNFPHITILSFISGHLLLLQNSLLTFRLHYRKLSFGEIALKLSLLSVIMFAANAMFHGNYGFLSAPPPVLADFVNRCIPMYPVALTLVLIGLAWVTNELIAMMKASDKASPENAVNTKS